jgi:hypothetical protein
MTLKRKLLIGMASVVGLLVVAIAWIMIDNYFYNRRVDREEAAKEAARQKPIQRTTWVPADARNPQIYWADKSIDSCASVEFDPRHWRAGSDKPVGEWMLDLSLRQYENFSWFSISCESGDAVYRMSNGKKYFDQKRGLRKAETDGYGKPMSGIASEGTFTTKEGKVGVRITRNFNFREIWDKPEADKKGYGLYYVIPVENPTDDLTNPLIVTVEATMPAEVISTYEKSVDEMAASLKFADHFPDYEAHSWDGYLSDDVKALYGTWDVGVCNWGDPVAMRWRMEPFDHSHALVTVESVQYRRSAKWHNLASSRKFKLKIEHTGIPGKKQVMVKGNGDDIKNTFKIDDEKTDYFVAYIFKNSPTSLHGQIYTRRFDWDEDSRGEIVFNRSDGKPLSAMKVCGLK